MIITAEPGLEFDELGALIPVYAKERGMQVAVLYVSDYGKRERALEALDGLSEAGYDVYPIFGGFTCDNYDSYHMASIGFDREILDMLKANSDYVLLLGNMRSDNVEPIKKEFFLTDSDTVRLLEPGKGRGLMIIGNNHLNYVNFLSDFEKKIMFGNDPLDFEVKQEEETTFQ